MNFVKNDDSDEALLRQMASGDLDAFTVIYRRYWEVLFVTAEKALRSKSDAADIIQDIFLSLWNRRQDINIESSLLAYLQTSVRFKAIHYIEKNITRRDYLTLLTETEINHIPAVGEASLQLKQVQAIIYETVDKMPPKMRAVYKLSRQEYLSHKEIADKLNISPETVKKHIQHALTLIKTALERSLISVPLVVLYLLH